MAITYELYCPKCAYQIELKVGLTKFEHSNKYPNVELATCKNCKVLTTTKDKQCPICNTKAETKNGSLKKLVLKY